MVARGIRIIQSKENGINTRKFAMQAGFGRRLISNKLGTPFR